MRTRIIAAFPGTGKTYFTAANPGRCLDSDSSQFSWLIRDGAPVTVNGAKVRNSEFPGNYIAHLKEQIGKYEFIFVSTHKEVRDALLGSCLFFYLVYPDLDDKQVYLQRYKDRGSPQAFVDLLDKNWLDWLGELSRVGAGCKKLCMFNHLFIDGEIQHLVRTEEGGQ